MTVHKGCGGPEAIGVPVATVISPEKSCPVIPTVGLPPLIVPIAIVGTVPVPMKWTKAKIVVMPAVLTLSAKPLSGPNNRTINMLIMIKVIFIDISLNDLIVPNILRSTSQGQVFAVNTNCVALLVIIGAVVEVDKLAALAFCGVSMT